MRKPGNTVILMRPVENRKRILLPDLLRARKPESYNVAAQSLVRILHVSCVPVPFGIPMEDLVCRRNGIVLPIDKWQICSSVLNLAVAAISQLRHYRQILWRHSAGH